MLKFAILAIVALTGPSYGQLVGLEKCTLEEAQEFDNAGAAAFVMNTGSKFPDSLREANKYCATSRKASKTLKSFSKKCLDALEKQATSLLGYGINKQIRKSCKDQNSRTQLYTQLKCLNSDMSYFDKAMNDYILYNQAIPSLPLKQRMSGLCCGFYGFIANLNARAREICPAADVQYFQAFVEGFTSDALELICASIPANAPVCSQIDIQINQTAISKTKSVVPPLLAVLGSF